MSSYESGLIGLDVKRRRNSKPRRNRYHTHVRWILPTTIALIAVVGLFVLTGVR